MALELTTPATEQTRARYPDESGYVERDGVRVYYEVYGSGEPTLLLLPTWSLMHSRHWKMQIPYLARHYRVVTYDGRGNGRSDRPTDPAAYADDRMTLDIAAVLDATGTDRAVLVGLCIDGVWRSIRLAADRPERVLGIVAFGIGVPRLAPAQPHYVTSSATFHDELPTPDGWEKMNAAYWRRDYPDFARFFFSEMTTEPHSTKAIEDATGWATDGSVEAMLAESEVSILFDLEAVETACRSVRCPMLLVHGTEDQCQSIQRAHRLADLTGAPLVVVDGANHMIPGRHPVLANLLIRDFVRSLEGGLP